jgi:hypothetical protein
MLQGVRSWLMTTAKVRSWLLTTTTSSIGFLLALAINGLVERWHEQDTFSSMVVSLHAEAESNQSVLSESYRKIFPEGIVIREFRTDTAQGLLSNPLFMKYAKAAEVEAINNYANDLRLMNGYRRVIESLFFKSDALSETWLKAVITNTQDKILSVETDVKEIIAIKH